MKSALVTLVAALFLVSSSNGFIICTDSKRDKCLETIHTESSFSSPLPELSKDGIKGQILLASNYLCDVTDVPKLKTPTILLTERGECDFSLKAKNAQDIGAVGLVVMDTAEDEEIVQMGARSDFDLETIPSVFIPSHESVAILEYITIAASMGEKTYGLLFAGDDVQPNYGVFCFRFLRVVFAHMMFFFTLLFAFLLIRKFFRCLCGCGRKPRNRPEYVELDLEEQESTKMPVVVIGVPVVVGVNDSNGAAVMGVALPTLV